MIKSIGTGQPADGGASGALLPPHATRGQRLRAHIFRMGRFGIVGILSTLTYFIVTAVLGGSPLHLNPLISNMLGVTVSLAVSYVGHHRFTFNAPGQHSRYLPRFLFVVTTLFLLSCGVMAAGRYTLKLDHTLVTAFIAVVFPALSFLVNMLWTFTHNNEADDGPAS